MNLKIYPNPHGFVCHVYDIGPAALRALRDGTCAVGVVGQGILLFKWMKMT